MELDDIYSEILMENARSKEYKKEIKGKKINAINASCGDVLIVQYILEEKDKKISEISFSGSGCAISEASANIMCKILIGKTISEALKIINVFINMIKKGEIDNPELIGEAIALKNIHNMPERAKCALLSWNSIKKELEKENIKKD